MLSLRNNQTNDEQMINLPYKFKIFLHNHIYNQEHFISDFKNLIESTDLFNLEYNDKLRCFNLKIKKTNIKRKYNYSHDSLFYYNIINHIFTHFFTKNKDVITVLLNNYGHMYNINPNDSNIEKVIYEKTQCLYNITALADNVVVVKL